MTDSAARSVGSFALAQSPLFVAHDGYGQECVWLDQGDADAVALLVPHDIAEPGRRALWAHITKGLPRRSDPTPDGNPHRGLAGHDNARKRAED